MTTCILIYSFTMLSFYVWKSLRELVYRLFLSYNILSNGATFKLRTHKNKDTSEMSVKHLYKMLV